MRIVQRAEWPPKKPEFKVEGTCPTCRSLLEADADDIRLSDPPAWHAGHAEAEFTCPVCGATVCLAWGVKPEVERYVTAKKQRLAAEPRPKEAS